MVRANTTGQLVSVSSSIDGFCNNCVHIFQNFKKLKGFGELKQTRVVAKLDICVR